MYKILRKSFTIFALSIFLAGQSMAFSDLKTTHPKYQAINWLKENNIVNGYENGTFKPDLDVKRAEALKMILLGSGIEEEKTPFKVMPDVEFDDWFAGFVLAGKNRGIIQGNDDGFFLPSESLNLAEALKMVLETKQVDISSIEIEPQIYIDVDSDQWFAAYFQYAKDKNILEQGSEEKVNPSKDMTRGDLAEIMFRVAIINQYSLESFDSTVIENGILLQAQEDNLKDEKEISDNNADLICKNLCSDGICQEIVCMGEGCPCAENAETCPQDCLSDKDKEKVDQILDEIFMEEISKDDEFAQDFDF